MSSRAGRPFGMLKLETIRLRLTAALAVALLPVLVLGGLQSAAAYQSEADHQRSELAAAAERAAVTTRARLESAVVVLQTLRSDTVGLYCAPRLERLVDRLAGFDSILRFDAAGRVVCASRAVTTSAAARPWFRRLAGGESLTLQRADSPGNPALLAAVRAERVDGGFDGAIVAVLPLETMRKSIPPDTLGRGAEAAIVDREGHVLTSTDPRAFTNLPAPLFAPHAPKVMDGHGSDELGRRRVFATAPLMADGPRVVLSTASQGAFTWALLNPVATLILPLLAWGAALGAVLIVSDQVMVRWLTYLERIASIYAKGRFSVRPVQARNAPVEIRALAKTLDEMASAIEQRDSRLRESLGHKDALLREIHHRVKNNLQVISSLLNMQQRSLTDPAARAAMSDTRQRITALALIYRALYQSPDLRRVDVRQFLEELVSQLVSSEVGRGGAGVRTELEADPLVIDPDKLAPLALWAVEAVTNAQKHAFNGRGGRLRIGFTVSPETCLLEVEDDGPGADPDSLGQGVGTTLMSAFARQLRGQAEVERGANGGLLARLRFPTPFVAAGPDPLASKAEPAAQGSV